MRFIVNALYCICLLLVVGGACQAKNWRGLVPLHSSREDVEKLLGPPPPPPSDGSWLYSLHAGRSVYILDEGEIYIVYANGKIPEWNDCAGKVPEGTVLLITVKPKKEMTLDDLHLDGKRLKAFDGSKPGKIGYQGYLDSEAGIGVRTYKGRVEEISYLAAPRDRHLCQSYYKNLKAFIQIQIAYEFKET
jgi:hypothetical protein